MAKWSKQTYEKVAEVIHAEQTECAYDEDSHGYLTLRHLASRFAQVFANDNAAFKGKKFLDACGFGE